MKLTSTTLIIHWLQSLENSFPVISRNNGMIWASDMSCCKVLFTFIKYGNGFSLVQNHINHSSFSEFNSKNAIDDQDQNVLWTQNSFAPSYYDKWLVCVLGYFGPELCELVKIHDLLCYWQNIFLCIIILIMLKT